MSICIFSKKNKNKKVDIFFVPTTMSKIFLESRFAALLSSYDVTFGRFAVETKYGDRIQNTEHRQPRLYNFGQN